MTEAVIALEAPELALAVFGVRDQNLRMLREALGVAVTFRAGQVHVSGDSSAVARATDAIEQMKSLAERRGMLAPEQMTELLARLGVTGGGAGEGAGATGGLAAADGTAGSETLVDGSTPARPAGPIEVTAPIEVSAAARRVLPRTAGQSYYVEAIRKHDLTFAIGPAGTGKTYLAVALAVEALKNRTVRKIVLCRPAVEAGESLGFLPGDLRAKINPYLRPLLDALHEMMDFELIKRLMEQDVIEVAPLAYMRGRTLNEAFIILDEGQNTTVAQMKMFLTRMGAGSKIVVSGDVTQVDLPSETRSGLTDAVRRLSGIQGVSVVQLTKADIVRHRLVQEIVLAYDRPHRTGTHDAEVVDARTGGGHGRKGFDGDR